MWRKITHHLPHFRSAVLSALDDEGYPASARCLPVLDRKRRFIRVQVPAGLVLRPGPASLLCHRHDNHLWNLHSFLLRGQLELADEGWCFQPEQFVPGAGVGGAWGFIQFIRRCRRTAHRYLEKRGLPRPLIPWDDIEACKPDKRIDLPNTRVSET